MCLNGSLCCGSHSYCRHSAAKFYSWESLQSTCRYSKQHFFFFFLWNRLHPRAVCQSPKARSVSAPVLNLMFCLAHWTQGHSKVKLELHKIRSERQGRKWKGVTRSIFRTWLLWRFFWAWKNGWLPYARLVCPRQRCKPVCLFIGNMPREREEIKSLCWDDFLLNRP